MSNTVRRERGQLEQLVLEVCKRIDNGGIATEAGKPWTPHRLAQEVLAAYPGAGANPSTGAISDTLKRWEGYGFAQIGHEPLAFIDFTDAARQKGLQALKDEARAARPPRAPKAQAAPLAPSGSVTMVVNPGQEDDASEPVQEDPAAAMASEIPTPAEALVEAEEATAEGEVEVISSPDGGNVVVYEHDEAEYAHGDPHPTANDDAQEGWTPRDEWDDIAAATPEAEADGDEPDEHDEDGSEPRGEFRDVRSIELDQDDPFAPTEAADKHPFDQN